MVHEYDQGEAIGSSRFRGQFLAPFLSFDLHEFTDGFVGDGWGISRCLFLSSVFIGLYSILWLQIPNLFLFTFEWLLGTSPIWLPILTLVTAWKVWMWYGHANYLFK